MREINDLSRYDTPETEWRYSVRMADAMRAYDSAQKDLAKAEKELHFLKNNPPSVVRKQNFTRLLDQELGLETNNA